MLKITFEVRRKRDSDSFRRMKRCSFFSESRSGGNIGIEGVGDGIQKVIGGLKNRGLGIHMIMIMKNKTWFLVIRCLYLL